MGILGSILDGKKSKKQQARERLEKNKARGKAGERQVEFSASFRGIQLKRNRKGPDYTASQTSLGTWRLRQGGPNSPNLKGRV